MQRDEKRNDGADYAMSNKWQYIEFFASKWLRDKIPSKTPNNDKVLRSETGCGVDLIIRKQERFQTINIQEVN